MAEKSRCFDFAAYTDSAFDLMKKTCITVRFSDT